MGLEIISLQSAVSLEEQVGTTYTATVRSLAGSMLMPISKDQWIFLTEIHSIGPSVSNDSYSSESKFHGNHEEEEEEEAVVQQYFEPEHSEEDEEEDMHSDPPPLTNPLKGTRRKSGVTMASLFNNQ